MKNLKGVICYSAATLFAVLTLAWNATAFITVRAGGISASTSIFDVYSKTATGDTQTAKIMSIIALVLACVLALGCVLALLNELGIVKVKFMNYVNCALAGLFVLFALLAIIFCGMACADANKIASQFGTTSSVGVGLIMVLISALVALAAVVFATVSKKNKAE